MTTWLSAYFFKMISLNITAFLVIPMLTNNIHKFSSSGSFLGNKIVCVLYQLLLVKLTVTSMYLVEFCSFFQVVGRHVVRRPSDYNRVISKVKICWTWVILVLKTIEGDGPGVVVADYLLNDLFHQAKSNHIISPTLRRITQGMISIPGKVRVIVELA